METREKVAVIGLGKLGSCLAAFYGTQRFDVVGIDNNKLWLEKFRKECPVPEPGLPELLTECRKLESLEMTVDWPKIRDCSKSFIIVPTPSKDDDKFDDQYVMDAVSHIAEQMKWMKQYHLIVIVSTVMPGTTAKVAATIEQLTGRKCGTEFGVCYSPEFIALGNVVEGMRYPDSLLIGESDEKAGDKLGIFYRQIYHTMSLIPPVHRMGMWNAEVTKIALNTFLTTKISLANTYADICQRIPGGDVDKLVKFLGSDSRIGPKYLKSGLGFGGPCFPRDNRAFMSLARTVQTQARIAESTDRVNARHLDEIIGIVCGIPDCQKISVLGFAYKNGTSVTTESKALELAEKLHDIGRYVVCYDPIAKSQTVEQAWSIGAVIVDSDLVILGTEWPEFKEITPRLLKRLMRTPRVLDCWRMWDGKKMRDGGVEYHAIGISEIGNQL